MESMEMADKLEMAEKLGKPLVEAFKEEYRDYRQAADVDESFRLARQALAYRVIGEAGRLAELGEIDAIRDLIRQFKELQSSTYGSNDSVKERFEAELQALRH